MEAIREVDVSEYDRILKIIIDYHHRTGRPMKELTVLPDTFDRLTTECRRFVTNSNNPALACEEIQFAGVKITRVRPPYVVISKAVDRRA
jgi:hypothetical protein